MRVDAIAGRFALCDPIAGGGTGTVWRAWDLWQRRFCAAKVLRQRDSGDLIPGIAAGAAATGGPGT